MAKERSQGSEELPVAMPVASVPRSHLSHDALGLEYGAAQAKFAARHQEYPSESSCRAFSLDTIPAERTRTGRMGNDADSSPVLTFVGWIHVSGNYCLLDWLGQVFDC